MTDGATADVGRDTIIVVVGGIVGVVIGAFLASLLDLWRIDPVGS